jgi:hypothetical protein
MTRLALLIFKGGAKQQSLLALLARALSFFRIGKQACMLQNDKALTFVKALLFVGTTRFELATPCTPCKCATGLRYVPNICTLTSTYWGLQK